MAKASRKPSRRRFYAQALTAAERAALPEAIAMEGIDEELAALRLRLRTALELQPADLPLILRGMDVLRRMVVTRYSLSKEDEQALASAFAAETLRRLQERGKGGGADDVA